MAKCPVDSRNLDEIKYEGVAVDHCGSCGGVWLDAKELETIQETRIMDFSEALSKPENLVAAAFSMAKSGRERDYQCVRCDAVLIKREYGYASQIQVDVCPEGHGMWLDHGELQALEKFYERMNAEADSEFAALEAEIKSARSREGVLGFLRSFWS